MTRYGSRYYTEQAETHAPAKPMSDTVVRPDVCPSCRGRVIDTLAKVITVTTAWRCRGCEHTWSIGTRGAAGREIR